MHATPSTSLGNLLDVDEADLASALPLLDPANRNNASERESIGGELEDGDSSSYQSSSVHFHSEDNLILEDFSGDQMSWGHRGRDMNMINLASGRDGRAGAGIQRPGKSTSLYARE